MSGEPLGDGWNMAPDLVKLDDAEGLVRPVILQQGYETLCGREVFESQRALAAVLASQYTVGVPAAVFRCGDMPSKMSPARSPSGGIQISALSSLLPASVNGWGRFGSTRCRPRTCSESLSAAVNS